MDVKLVVATGTKAGQAITVNVPKFFIGRAEDCHLKPRSELVSRYHCALISEESYLGVRDMKSKNGVYVNGERVVSEKELKHGDLLVVGPLEFTVQLSVSLKGEKKPKVESVKEAVARTVQVAAAQPVVEAVAKPAGETSNVSQGDRSDEGGDISDWLMGDDETEAPETQTIELSDVSDELKELHSSATENPSEDDESQNRVDPPSTPKPAMANQKIGDSRDAAANLLKNFFKGGR